MAVRDGLGMCHGPPSLVGMLLAPQASHVAIPSAWIVCMCCVLGGWDMHIGFFHVSVSQHEAKLGQHHQHGQLGENTGAQVRRETQATILHSGSISSSPASLGCPSARAALLSLQSSVWAPGPTPEQQTPWVCTAWL